jgi:hypothetical protein
LAGILASEDSARAKMVAEMVVNILINQREVVCHDGLLSIPVASIVGLEHLYVTKKRKSLVMNNISNLRFKALNKIHRGKNRLAWRKVD